jgi:hypothetical protein
VREKIPLLTHLPINKYEEYTEMNYELLYLNEIQQSTKNLKFVEVSHVFPIKNESINERMFLILVSWLFKIIGNFEYSNDILLNVIPKIINLYNMDIKKRQYQGYGIMLMFIADYQVNPFPVDMHYCIDSCAYCFTKDDLVDFLRDLVLNLKHVFSYVPVRTHLTYLKVELQKKGIECQLIKNILKYITEMLFYWVIYNKGRQYSIWKLIYHSYISNGGFPDMLYFFDEIDDNLLDLLEIIKLTPDKIELNILHEVGRYESLK